MHSSSSSSSRCTSSTSGTSSGILRTIHSIGLCYIRCDALLHRSNGTSLHWRTSLRSVRCTIPFFVCDLVLLQRMLEASRMPRFAAVRCLTLYQQRRARVGPSFRETLHTMFLPQCDIRPEVLFLLRYFLRYFLLRRKIIASEQLSLVEHPGCMFCRDCPYSDDIVIHFELLRGVDDRRDKTAIICRAP